MCQNSCASTVAGAIAAVDGVNRVAVSYAKKRALVEGHFDQAAVAEAVDSVGFDIQYEPHHRNNSLIKTELDAAVAAGGPGVKISSSPLQSDAVREKGAKKLKPAPPPSRGRMWTCDYVVSGIVCASCAGRIETAVRELDGVSMARVGVITEKLNVCFDPDLQSQSVIEAAVEALGYSLTLVRSVAVGNAAISSSGDPDTLQPTDLNTHVMLVTGMTCANCATKIDRALRKLEGVQHVNISVTTNRVEVEVQPTAAIPSSKIAGVRTILNTIEDLGFGVSINLKSHFG